MIGENGWIMHGSVYGKHCYMGFSTNNTTIKYGTLLFLSICVSATITFFAARMLSEDNRIEQHRYESSLIAEKITHNLEIISHLCENLSHHPAFYTFFSENPYTSTSCEYILEAAKSISAAHRVFILDTMGNCVSSTTVNSSYSLVGYNFRQHPYFQRALNNESSIYPGTDPHTDAKGLYFSSPIPEPETGGVLGVVVIAMGEDYIEQTIPSSDNNHLLVTQEGVVFYTQTQEWLYKSIYPLTDQQRAVLSQTQQFATKDIIAFDFNMMQDKVRVGNDSWFIDYTSLGITNWGLISMHEDPHKLLITSNQKMILVLSNLLFISLLFGLIIVLLNIKRRLKIEVELRTYKDNLENMVAQQTRELEQRNKELEKEIELRTGVEEQLCSLLNEWDIIFESIQDMAALLRPDLTVLKCNTALAKLFGKEINDLIGQRCALSSINSNGTMSVAEKVKLTGQPESTEMYAAGLDKHLEISCYPVLDDSNNLRTIMLIARDITERKQNELILREDEERFRTILNTVLAGVIIVDRDKRTIVDINPEAERILAVKKQDMVDELCPDPLFPPVERKTRTIVECSNEESTVFDSHQNSIPVVKTVRSMNVLGKHLILISFLDIRQFKAMEQRLQDHLTFMKLMMNAIPLPVFYQNPDGIFTGCNEAFEKMVGRPADLITGKDILSITTQPVARTYTAEFKTIIAQGGKKTFESRFMYGDKTTHDVIFTLSTYPIGTEKIGGVVGIITDITERKAAEEKTISIAKFPEEDPAPVIRVDRTGIILYANNPGKLVLNKWKTDIGKSIPSEWIKVVQNAMRYNAKMMMEEECLKRFYSFLIVPIHGTDYINIYGSDETLKHQLKKSLDEQATLLKNIISNIPSYIYWKDKKRVFMGCNATFAKIVGLDTPEDIVGKTDADLPWTQEQAEWYRTSDEQVIESAQPLLNIEETIIHPDGKEMTILNSKVPFFNHLNEVAGVIGIYTDITELKRIEEQRLKLARDMSQAQKLESIGTLAAGIAHEINTPIQFIGDNTRFVSDSINALIELIGAYHEVLTEIEKLSTPCETAENVRQIETDIDLQFLEQEIPLAIEQTLEGVNRVSQIVSAMKDFSHMGNNEKAQEDINRAVESTITISRNEWKYVADIKKELDTSIPCVNCVIADIKQVVLNLLINASHAIKDAVDSGLCKKGLITVKTYKQNNYVVISVTDTGMGIPTEIHGKIFDQFFTTKGVGKGTGQGLALAYSAIVQKHNGKLTFDTKMKKGTTFYIHLPLE